MADDWDLQAVVRGCATNTTTTSCSGTTTSTSTASCSTDVYQRLAGTGRSFEQGQPGPGQGQGQGQGQDGNFIYLQDLFFEPRNGIQELNDLYKPFFQKTSPPVSPQSNSIPISPLSVLGEFQDLSQLQQNPQGQQSQRQNIYQPKQSLLRTGASSSHNPSPRSKRRKNQMKRVCQVPAEALSSDTWSWRKYGQKPIKGSPYPRGYYRCSTSKGCLARKQVERNRSDPGMFIVTYTAEHNHPMPTHRNTLAGSTRQKPATVTGNSDDTNKPDSSPMVSSGTSLSPAPEKLELESSSKEEIMEEEDDDINAPEMPMDDDFFEGLEELAENSSAGDIFSGHLPPSSQSMQFPWLATNATTTAAGGV